MVSSQMDSSVEFSLPTAANRRTPCSFSQLAAFTVSAVSPDFEVRNATVLSVMRLQSPVIRLADSTFSTGRRDIWRM